MTPHSSTNNGAGDDRLAIHGGTPVRSGPLEQRNPFGADERTEVLEALDSGNLFYATGTKVYEFLDLVRTTFGVQHVVPTSSGTAALHVAVGALDVKPGDEIIVPPVTDMGSIAPIVLSGAVPVYVDIDPTTFAMDAADVARKITDRTRAIMVVHVWGRPVDIDAIRTAVNGRDIAIIEDCAEAHYIRYKGQLLGTIGDIGCFSYQQSKHITSGDGGLTIINRDDLAPRAELFVDKGCDWTQDRVYRKTYAFMAPCYRMTELQGAVLKAQMKRLPDLIVARSRNGAWLARELADVAGIAAPPVPDEQFGHGYWGFPLRVIESELGASRNEFREALAAEGIKSDTWIDKPLYLYDALAQHISFGGTGWPFVGAGNDQPRPLAGLCPKAELAMSQLVNINRIHETTTEDELRDVARAVKKVARLLRG